MIKKYFEIKTKEKNFDENLNNLLDELKDKKVIIYGRNREFLALNKKYNLKERLNIVAITDDTNTSINTFNGIKNIDTFHINDIDFESILIINSKPIKTEKYLTMDLFIQDKEIKSVFTEEIPDECENLNYLYKHKFDKTLPKLIKKLKNKKVMLYGAGAFLELIKKYFDISSIDIIGISDKRFSYCEQNESFLGYPAYSPDKIKDSEADYVIVTTKMYVNIIEDLYYETLKDTKIKIKPLLKKGFFTLLKEL